MAHERELTRPDAEKRAGSQLRKLREARGWSQREVAERMKPYGYSWGQDTVSRVEAATRPTRLNEMLDLAALFGVSLTDLLASPAGTDSLDDVRQEAQALRLALAQAEVRRAETAQEAAESAEAHAVTLAEVESIRARLRLLEEWEREALGDAQA